MKPTIRDVAEFAGVSVATVSRYLNNSSLIAPSSIEKVRNAIEALNYQPNMMARGLAKRSTDTVALVVDYSNEEIYGNEFFLKIQFGLERELARNGYYLMIVDISNDEKEPELLNKIVLEERVDGIILLNEMAKAPIIEQLRKTHIPFVIAGRGDYQDISWVDVDNVQGGYIATKKLIDSGAVNIGFVTNSFQKRFVRERFSGFQQAMSEHRLSYKQQSVVEGMTSFQDQAAYIATNIDNLCDAYVVTDSSIAFFFMKALQAMRLSVPRDVQIISFDNQLLAEISEPGMTVVDIDVTELGEHAARILLTSLRQTEKGGPMQELLNVRLVERKSTL